MEVEGQAGVSTKRLRVYGETLIPESLTKGSCPPVLYSSQDFLEKVREREIYFIKQRNSNLSSKPQTAILGLHHTRGPASKDRKQEDFILPNTEATEPLGQEPCLKVSPVSLPQGQWETEQAQTPKPEKMSETNSGGKFTNSESSASATSGH